MKNTFFIGIAILLFSFSGSFAFAQSSSGPGSPIGQSSSGPGASSGSTQLINPLSGVDCSGTNGNCVSAFLGKILDFVIQIGTVIVILMLVFTGYKFVAAQGAPGAIEEARSMLLWTIIGALILLGAKSIQLGITATVQALGSGS